MDGWQGKDIVADGVQRLRAVLADGRRLDALVRGVPIRMPTPPADADVRFGAADHGTRSPRRHGRSSPSR